MDEADSSDDEKKEVELELYSKIGSGQKYCFDIADLCRISF